MNFDPAKNAANIANHGLDLSFGDRVMADGQALHALDDSLNYGEERWNVVGMVDGVVYHLTYTDRDDGFRYISLRRASKRETDLYFIQAR
jgi:uncharacterized DUF497 family protein